MITSVYTRVGNINATNGLLRDMLLTQSVKQISDEAYTVEDIEEVVAAYEKFTVLIAVVIAWNTSRVLHEGINTQTCI